MVRSNVTEGDNLSNRGWSVATPPVCNYTNHLAESEYLTMVTKILCK